MEFVQEGFLMMRSLILPEVNRFPKDTWPISPAPCVCVSLQKGFAVTARGSSGIRNQELNSADSKQLFPQKDSWSNSPLKKVPAG